MAPPGETCVVLEIPCDPGDVIWRMTDKNLVETCVGGLARAAGFDRALVLESSVHRIGHAYPVLERGSENRVAEMLRYCAQFANLRLAGRNALFRYAHLHEMLRQGRQAADALFGSGFEGSSSDV
jgi:protoporphyrinogen oxidase